MTSRPWWKPINYIFCNYQSFSTQKRDDGKQQLFDVIYGRTLIIKNIQVGVTWSWTAAAAQWTSLSTKWQVMVEDSRNCSKPLEDLTDLFVSLEINQTDWTAAKWVPWNYKSFNRRNHVASCPFLPKFQYIFDRYQRVVVVAVALVFNCLKIIP